MVAIFGNESESESGTYLWHNSVDQTPDSSKLAKVDQDDTECIYSFPHSRQKQCSMSRRCSTQDYAEAFFWHACLSENSCFEDEQLDAVEDICNRLALQDMNGTTKTTCE